MPMVWLSTFKKLIHYGIDRRRIASKFSGYAEAKRLKLTQFEITDDEKKLLDNFCDKIKYDACKSCSRQICNSKDSHICQCPSSREYQQEYRYLQTEIAKLENAHATLVATPFRQLRNSYGYVGSLFGGLNLIITTFLAALKISLIVSLGLIAVPPILAGMWIYVRGKREERKINSDNQADVIDKKITLLFKHRSLVNARYQHTLSSLNRKRPTYLQDFSSLPIKPSKEKRGIFGNPFSHFTIAALATLSMTVSVLKLAWPATLGGPFAIAGVVTASLLIGIYFGINRYKHLTSKIAYENQMSLITGYESKLKKISKLVKKNQKTNQNVVHIQPDKSNKHELRTHHRRHQDRKPSSLRHNDPEARMPRNSFITTINPSSLSSLPSLAETTSLLSKNRRRNGRT